MEYNTSQLPEIDAVEVVNLRDIMGNRVNTYMKEAVSAPFVRVTGEVAQDIARLWRLLPVAEQMRCHVPSFGLRFYNNDNLHLQASVCWQCNNIFVDIGEQELSYTFDAQHSYSQELLALVKQIMA
jgi:hypothetical protein